MSNLYKEIIGFITNAGIEGLPAHIFTLAF